MKIQDVFVILTRLLAIGVSFLIAFIIIGLEPRAYVLELHQPHRTNESRIFELHQPHTTAESCGLGFGQPHTPIERGGADVSSIVAPTEGSKQVIHCSCSARAAAKATCSRPTYSCMEWSCRAYAFKAYTWMLTCRRRLLTTVELTLMSWRRLFEY